jgi:hypothetical protein
MKYKKIFVVALIGFIVTVSFAQSKQELRIETELKSGYGKEQIFKSTNGYFILQAESDKSRDLIKEFRYDLYDQALNLVKSTTLSVPAEMKNCIEFNNDNNIYKLFVDSKAAYVLFTITIDGLKIDSIKGDLPKHIKVQNMKILNNKAWLQTHIKKKTCIVQIDLLTGKSLVSECIEKEAGKRTSIVNYQFSPVSGELLVFVNKYIKKGECELKMLSVNENCEFCNKIQLTGTDDKVVSSVSGSRVSENEMIYTGTYSNSKTNRSEGIFFAKTIDEKMIKMNYINFLNMKKFDENKTNFSKKITHKLKEIFERQGKELSIKYNVISHDVIVTPYGYLLVGEVYNPTYNTYTTPITTFVNGMTTIRYQTHSIFAGYQYTHAFVAGFSNDGELLWDQSFNMYPIEKPYTPKRFIRISEKTDSHISLVYTSRGIIGSKIISFDGKIEKENDLDHISLNEDNEKVTSTTSGAEYWYDNFFLIYGVQTFKNKDDKKRRTVFFVNKVEI